MTLPDLAQNIVSPEPLATWKRKWRSLRRIDGLITVIMPAYNVEKYVADSIRSILDQDYRTIQLIVVDDASTDGTAQVVKSLAKQDARIRLVRTKNGGPNAARNYGLRFVRGQYVTFLDSDDRLLPGAYSAMVSSLKASSSQFVVGGYRRIREGEDAPSASWIRRAHKQERLRCSLADFPDIMVNAVQWTKLYTTTFWDRRVQFFSEPGYYQDQLVSARAYSLATHFDVLDRDVVGWRVREDQSSMTQQILTQRNMSDRFRTAKEALIIYLTNSSARVYNARLTQYLNYDFGYTIGQLDESVSDEYWQALVTEVTDFISLIPNEKLWNRVYAQHKVMYHLIAQNRRQDAISFIALGGRKVADHAFEVRGEDFYYKLPFWGDSNIPHWAFRAAPKQVKGIKSRES